MVSAYNVTAKNETGVLQFDNRRAYTDANDSSKGGTFYEDFYSPKKTKELYSFGLLFL